MNKTILIIIFFFITILVSFYYIHLKELERIKELFKLLNITPIKINLSFRENSVKDKKYVIIRYFSSPDVIIHEAAHILDVNLGHTDSFNKIYNDLIKLYNNKK